MRLLPSFVHNVREGIKAGYRPCCIAWFSVIFNPILSYFPQAQFRYHKWLWWRLPGNWSIFSIQYIPCPLCMVRRSFDKSDPFAGRAPLDVSLEDYEEMMEEYGHELFMDEEPH